MIKEIYNALLPYLPYIICIAFAYAFGSVFHE